MFKISKELARKYLIRSRNFLEQEKYLNCKNYKAQKKIKFLDNFARFGVLVPAKLMNFMMQELEQLDNSNHIQIC